MEPSGKREFHAPDDRNATAGGPSPDTTSNRADGNGETFSFPSNVVNVAHQRRRVNPESLALRLGPDLVRDLDALITPGNTEMPSFAVRKELQERYSIDRRHIYDYFHSRGLRVVKEDKQGNPVPTKDFPTPLPNLRLLRQAPVKSIRSHPPYPLAPERKLFKPREVTKAKLGRPRKIPGSAKMKIIPNTCETNEPTDASASVSGLFSPVADHPTYVTVNPLLSHNPLPPMPEENENHAVNQIINPLDVSFSVRHTIEDITCAYRHKTVLERMQDFAVHPTKYYESFSWDEASPYSAGTKGALLPHLEPLTRDERHAIYGALSDSIGPARGIQECQGTYRKHMEARTKVYFEGLLPVSFHYTQQPTRTTTSLDRNPALGSNEFRHWLSETRFLKRGVNSSPRLHPSHRNANVPKHQDIDEVTDKHSKRSFPDCLQTLDELFPTPGGNLNNDDPLTDSPIVHAREITLGDGCSAGDRRLFSVMPSPGLPILSATSATEMRQVGQPQVHGSSGIPGPQDVKTPIVRMDSRPQWSKHDPCVTPGQHLTSNDKLRRSRHTSNNSRICVPSCSPRKYCVRDPDRVWTRPVTSRDPRRRTTSAAGDM